MACCALMESTSLLRIMPRWCRIWRWIFVSTRSNKSSLYQGRIQLTVCHRNWIKRSPSPDLGVVTFWGLGSLLINYGRYNSHIILVVPPTLARSFIMVGDCIRLSFLLLAKSLWSTLVACLVSDLSTLQTLFHQSSYGDKVGKARGDTSKHLFPIYGWKGIHE